MQQREHGQDVGIDRRILQQRGVDHCRAGMFEKRPGIGFVQIAGALAGNPDQDEVGDQQKQEGGVYFPGPARGTREYGCPALVRQRPTIGQHAGIAGHKHKHFAGVAEAVIAKR